MFHHQDLHSQSHAFSGCWSVLLPTDFSITPVLNHHQFQGTPPLTAAPVTFFKLRCGCLFMTILWLPLQRSSCPLTHAPTLFWGQLPFAMATLTFSGSCPCSAPDGHGFQMFPVPGMPLPPFLFKFIHPSDCHSTVVSSEVTGPRACYKLRHVVLRFWTYGYIFISSQMLIESELLFPVEEKLS